MMMMNLQAHNNSAASSSKSHTNTTRCTSSPTGRCHRRSSPLSLSISRALPFSLGLFIGGEQWRIAPKYNTGKSLCAVLPSRVGLTIIIESLCVPRNRRTDRRKHVASLLMMLLLLLFLPLFYQPTNPASSRYIMIVRAYTRLLSIAFTTECVPTANIRDTNCTPTTEEETDEAEGVGN